MSKEQADNQENIELADEQAELEDAGASVVEQPQAASEQDEAVLKLSQADTLRQEIESLKQQVEENLDKAVRAQAELDNLRKRSARDVESAHKYALEKFVNGLLPVIDSMVLGISASENVEDVDSLREGMDLTLKMFLDTLEKFGIAEVDPQGEKFNPEKHEAVSMQQIEGTESGMVVTVMQKGYELNGRLVRPAMVVVAK